MAEMKSIKITGASVKVMRSYDYCHFEVALSSVDNAPIHQIVHREDGSVEEIYPLDSSTVDELRKEAMRLADKAVEQYKIAKKIEEFKLEHAYQRSRLQARAEEVMQTPESERTPGQLAALKALEDYNFLMQFEYDYEDDWDEEAWEAAEDAI